MAEKKLKPPSELFEETLHSAGHLVADCTLCDRVHFATLSEGIYDEGELERIREQQKKEPDRYIEDASNDTIAVGFLDGNEVVIGCPCHRLGKYEAFIWTNRRFIAEYLKKRIELQKAQADQDTKLAEGL